MDAYELLTKDEMTILKEHYVMVKDCTSQDQRDRALKAWTEPQKRYVVRLLDKLRSYGLYIAGQYPSGSLRFAVAVKSPLTAAMELSDEDFMAYRKGLIKFVGGKWCSTEAACR